MPKPERRITPRYKLHTSMSFHRMEDLADGGQQTSAINISTRGVYFATSLAMLVGEAVEVLLEIPKRVTGVKATARRFTGRVRHVESTNMPAGTSAIGVELLCYERDSVGIAEANAI